MKAHFYILGLAALAACSSDKGTGAETGAQIITANDFESMAGWVSDLSGLDRGRAHSGQYTIKVDGQREFSLGFDVPLTTASPRKFKKVLLEAWAFLPSEQAAPGVLGIQIMDPTNNQQQIWGDGIVLGEQVKTFNKWTPVSKEFVLPDNINPTHHLRMSLWRASASDVVLVDDVKLSIKD